MDGSKFSEYSAGHPMQQMQEKPVQPQVTPTYTNYPETTVQTQPKALKKPQYTPNPYSYLLYVSMINSFLCCFCTGLVAVYYSTKVNSSWVYGEFQNAGKYAQRAKIWNVLTAAVGFLLVVTMVVLVTLSNTGFLLSSSTTRQTSSTRYNFHFH